MNRTVTFGLLTGALFLLFMTLSVGKPGLPVTLKADEPAYYLMALSLARDGDLECGAADYRRAFDGYPYLPTENLILMTGQQSPAIYFGKPFVYSAVTAPLAALFGANGLVAVNALLLCLMIAMGTAYLRQFNSHGRAALFATAFFVLSPAFHYVFWLQPEIFNMASAMGCLFFALIPFRGGPAGGTWRRLLFGTRSAPFWSGALLAFGTYNKPVLALIGLPALYLVNRRSGLKGVASWMLAAVLAIGLIAAASFLLTGHPTPYLGVLRTGLRIEDPDAMEAAVEQAFGLLSVRSTTANSWSWIFRFPTPDPRELLENVGYFFWGRHTGLLLYFPFALVTLFLFLLHQRHSVARWLMLASIAAIALFFLIFIPFNWHGGGGFIGNRYFIMAYPVMLFLVSSLKPLWTLPAGAALAGISLGSILLTPFGAPVPQPTLQAHVRGGVFRFFPHELTLRQTVPGYEYMAQRKVLLIGRKDVFRTHKPTKKKEWIDGATLQKTPLLGGLDHSTAWIHGATKSEVLVMTEEPIEGIFFEVGTWAKDNVVTLDLGGDRHELTFENASTPPERKRLVEFRPKEFDRYHYESGKRYLVYSLRIEPLTGRRVVERHDPTNIFYLGAQLRFLGRRNQVMQPEHYRIEWLTADAPSEIATSSEFDVSVVIRNAGESPLSSEAALPVYLSYHWLDRNRQRIVFGGRRTRLPETVAPGLDTSLSQRIIAPDEPGRYWLILDAVREHVSWFSQRGGSVREIEIDVVSARPALAAEETREESRP